MGGEGERRARAYVVAKFNAHGRRWGPPARGGLLFLRLRRVGTEAGGSGCGWGRGPRAPKRCGGGSKRAPRGPCAPATSGSAGWGAVGPVGDWGQGQAATSCPSRDRWPGPRLGAVAEPRGGASAGAVGVGSCLRPGPWAPRAAGGHRPRHVLGGCWWGRVGPPAPVPCPVLCRPLCSAPPLFSLSDMGTRSRWARGCGWVRWGIPRISARWWITNPVTVQCRCSVAVAG